jgi:hypothetical protein
MEAIVLKDLSDCGRQLRRTWSKELELPYKRILKGFWQSQNAVGNVWDLLD